jgi:hypothetical protein
MTPAEFRCMREYLGLPLNWVASNLGVTERTVNRWENGVTPIPDHASADLAHLVEYTGRCVEKIMRTRKQHGQLITTTDDDMVVDGFPASWHRMVCARVAAETGLAVRYGPKPTDTRAPYARRTS